MTELEKWEKVHECETIAELEHMILNLQDEDGKIQGKSKKFDAGVMSDNVKLVVLGNYPANILTRNYGIRAQALYLRFYLRQRKF